MAFQALGTALSSFRTQLVAFITAMLLLTGMAILLINRNIERRTTQVVDEYIRTLPLAIDIAYHSMNEGVYLYKYVRPYKADGLPIDSESVVRRILIVETNNVINDSTLESEQGKQLSAVLQGTPSFQANDLQLSANAFGADELRSLSFSIETQDEMGRAQKRNIIILISMNRLKRVKENGDRARLLAIGGLSLVLLLTIAAFSKRFTRPILELERAAQRVAAGQLEQNVPVGGPKEVSTLSATFNEMLTGLRRNRDLEDQLQRAERSAVVGRLASGIAHEIRNPLNFMNLSIDHLQAVCTPELNQRRAEFTHITTTIKEEIARLNKLVSDFLSYGRPARLKPRALDARVLIEEVRALVKAQADQQGVQLSLTTTGNGDTLFQADYEQIKTCFSNLMINAIQAMPEGGALAVTIHANTDANELQLTFADTGIGIEADNLTNIFEPYYSTKETGIGLGLPLTKKIIEEHNGTITVQSTPGQGTTFTVTLPK